MDDPNNPSIPASTQPTTPDPLMAMPMPGPMTTTTTTTQPLSMAEQPFGGTTSTTTSTPTSTTTSTTTETLPPTPPTTVTPEVQWPGSKPKSKLPQILGGIAAIILVVGVATAAYFVSSRVSGRQAVAPNAPESEPLANGGCQFNLAPCTLNGAIGQCKIKTAPIPIGSDMFDCVVPATAPVPTCKSPNSCMSSCNYGTTTGTCSGDRECCKPAPALTPTATQAPTKCEPGDCDDSCTINKGTCIGNKPVCACRLNAETPTPPATKTPIPPVGACTTGNVKCVGSSEFECINMRWFYLGACSETPPGGNNDNTGCSDFSAKNCQGKNPGDICQGTDRCELLENQDNNRCRCGGGSGGGGGNSTACPTDKRDTPASKTFAFAKSGKVIVFSGMAAGTKATLTFTGPKTVNVTTTEGVAVKNTTTFDVTAGETYTMNLKFAGETKAAYGWLPPQSGNMCGPVKNPGNGKCGALSSAQQVVDLATANSDITGITAEGASGNIQCWGDAAVNDSTQDYDYNDYAIVLGYDNGGSIGACVEITLFLQKTDGTYAPMTDAQRSSLKIGNKIGMIITGNATNLKARFRVSIDGVVDGDWFNSQWGENKTYHYDGYEIKSAGNYTFEGQVSTN